MDQKELIKKLKNSNGLYKNVENYIENLKASTIIKLSIEHIINKDMMANAYNKYIKTNPVNLPFDNIYFEVRGAELYDIWTNLPLAQTVGMHIQPAEFHIKGHKLVTMLLQEYRSYEDNLVSKSYLIYADLAGIHIMPMANKLAAQEGCKCYETNPFNNNLAFMTNIQSKMPCFSLDNGFAKAACSQPKSACSSVMAGIDLISKLLKTVLAYTTLPSNFLVKVIDEKDEKPYYIVSDTAQLYDLKCGKEKAELYGNIFADGASYDMAIKVDKITVEDQTFANKTKTYVINSK